MVADTVKKCGKTGRGFTLLEFILTIMAIFIIVAGMIASETLLGHQAQINNLAQKTITNYVVITKAATAYVQQNNITSATTITCSQLVPDYLPSSSDCNDTFGNTLSVYFDGQNTYYIYPSSYSSAYQGWLNSYKFYNLPALESFYSSVLAVLSKIGQQMDGAYDVLATNNSNMYDLAYGFKSVSNSIPVSVPLPSDPNNQGYAFVVRYIQY